MIYFYVHWCIACMYVCVRVSDPLEMELQRVVSYHMGVGKLHWGPLEEHPVLSTTKPSLQL